MSNSQYGGMMLQAPRFYTERQGNRNMLLDQPDNFVQAQGASKKKSQKRKNVSRKKALLEDISRNVSTVSNAIGSEVIGSITEIKKMLTQERKLFRKNLLKNATQTKKLQKLKGSTNEQAMAAQRLYVKSQKDDLKRLLFKVQLHALKELNANLI